MCAFGIVISKLQSRVLGFLLAVRWNGDADGLSLSHAEKNSNVHDVRVTGQQNKGPWITSHHFAGLDRSPPDKNRNCSSVSGSRLRWLHLHLN